MDLEGSLVGVLEFGHSCGILSGWKTWELSANVVLQIRLWIINGDFNIAGLRNVESRQREADISRSDQCDA